MNQFTILESWYLLVVIGRLYAAYCIGLYVWSRR